MGGPRTGEVRPLHLWDAWLRDAVHFTSVGDDVVGLDLDQDQYFCLPDAGSHMTLSGSHIRAPKAWVEALRDAGLTERGQTSPRAAPPAPPSTTLPASRRPVRLGDALAVVRALADAQRHGPTPPIRRILDTLPRRRARNFDQERAMAITTVVQATLPWAPRQGACLYRTSVLLRALRYAGQDATWVFGVRTWPFSAHCWLQIGDLVLDDDPDRVGLFTPIMAV